MRVLASAMLVVLLAGAGAGQDLKRLQREFMRVGDRVIPATVVVKAEGAMKGLAGSSGVIISEDGLVLSDADASLKAVKRTVTADGKVTFDKTHTDFVLVRLPEPDRRRFRAKVIVRDAEADVSLLQLLDPPRRLPTCPIGDSDDLTVGSFAYVCGNSFGMGNEGKPALSAGIVSALIPRADADGPAGKYQTIYTSAAVNPGNNGGPLVDLEGRLIGIISTFDPNPVSPFRGFGVAVPIHRVLSRLRGAALAGKNLPEDDSKTTRQRESRILEQATQILSRRAAKVLVSLEVDRGGEVITQNVRIGRQVVPIPRYPGPYSGMCWAKDGLILTSTLNLYAFDKIAGIQARLPDGRVLPAKVLARDGFRKLALLKVEADDLPTLAPVVEDDIEAGRFVLALGHPFGEKPHAGAFVTFGIVSAMHKQGAELDAIQTDAGLNDANVGGPLVDLRGRLIGMNLLVMPDRFGRNSGVGFAVPVWSIGESMAGLMAGKDRGPPFLGIRGLQPTKDKLWKFPDVTEGGPAYEGGLRNGDVLLSFDGKSGRDFKTPNEVIEAIRRKKAGERLVLEVVRGTEKHRLEIVMGARLEE